MTPNKPDSKSLGRPIAVYHTSGFAKFTILTVVVFLSFFIAGGVNTLVHGIVLFWVTLSVSILLLGWLGLKLVDRRLVIHAHGLFFANFKTERRVFWEEINSLQTIAQVNPNRPHLVNIRSFQLEITNQPDLTIRAFTTSNVEILHHLEKGTITFIWNRCVETLKKGEAVQFGKHVTLTRDTISHKRKTLSVKEIVQEEIIRAFGQGDVMVFYNQEGVAYIRIPTLNLPNSHVFKGLIVFWKDPFQGFQMFGRPPWK